MMDLKGVYQGGVYNCECDVSVIVIWYNLQTFSELDPLTPSKLFHMIKIVYIYGALLRAFRIYHDFAALRRVEIFF